MSDVKKVLVTELARHGISDYKFAQGGKHIKLHFAWRGVDHALVVPITASDHRAGLNARAHLRRRLRASSAEATLEVSPS